MFIDPLGLKPTIMEAALMAEHIYDHVWNENIDSRRVRDRDGYLTRWRLIDQFTDGDLKIGVYARGDGLDLLGAWYGDVSLTEYALVFKGTNPQSAEDWENNYQQLKDEYSQHMVSGITYTKNFIDSKAGYDITLIGHSKGGGEAGMNGALWNVRAILFNPSVPTFAYGIRNTNMVQPFVVTDEILNYVFDEFPIGETEYLPRQHNGWLPGISITDRVNNHSMAAVIAALKQADY
jgi:hypothetical protein